ncbi:unnamed protein product [Enterobius vermicularis]|uniref:Cation_ATPase_C domain-containing protein n=1 Tax=Enterobius vermicularis TaxID=51028 RepID=A0A0N4UXU4_ENTVE|nr:unnamed protein product [Enterobius vermicularis]
MLIFEESLTRRYVAAGILLVSLGVSFLKEFWEYMIVVGDIIRVADGEVFPADLLLLLSSNADETCLVETSKLDGENNPKVRRALGWACSLKDKWIGSFRCEIQCEPPNKNLKAFVGKMIVGKETYDLGEF